MNSDRQRITELMEQGYVSYSDATDALKALKFKPNSWDCPKLKVSIIIMIAFYISGCSDIVTETSTSSKTIELDDIHVLTVQKSNMHEETVGDISKHVYSTKDTFEYKLNLRPEAAEWEGKQSEPKKLLLCADNIYLHFVENRANPVYLEESRRHYARETDEPFETETPRELLGEYYSKFVDKRYFFKLLGDSYWVDVPSEQYQSKAEICAEHAVPNNNEFQFPR